MWNQERAISCGQVERNTYVGSGSEIDSVNHLPSFKGGLRNMRVVLFFSRKFWRGRGQRRQWRSHLQSVGRAAGTNRFGKTRINEPIQHRDGSENGLPLHSSVIGKLGRTISPPPYTPLLPLTFSHMLTRESMMLPHRAPAGQSLVSLGRALDRTLTGVLHGMQNSDKILSCFPR
jgi:hypothetical protein